MARQNSVCDLLNSCCADVVCLQEAKMMQIYQYTPLYAGVRFHWISGFCLLLVLMGVFWWHRGVVWDFMEFPGLMHTV